MKKFSLIATFLVLLGGIFSVTLQHAAAACPTNTANLGSVTGSFTIPVAGTYRVWSRMEADSTTASNNSYTLEIDGTTCGVTVGDATIPSSTWSWVDYKDGATGSKIDVTLTAGTHNYVMYGRESGVKVDKVVFSGNSNCVPQDDSATPANDGNNCAAAPTDVTPPTVSVTAPSAGSTVSNTTTISANATDNTSVASVSFYLDGSSTPLATDTTSPYSYAWATAGSSNGSHSIVAKAVDTAGNVGTSSTVNVTVTNTVTDATLPVTSITSPTNGQTISATATIAATATDNVGVTKVELYVDGAKVATDTTSPFSFAWDTTAATNASHNLVTKAYDAANNVGTSSTVSVTVSNTSSKIGDLNSNGTIGVDDLSIMLNNWMLTGRTSSQGDLDANGTVNILDLSILLNNWGK